MNTTIIIVFGVDVKAYNVFFTEFRKKTVIFSIHISPKTVHNNTRDATGRKRRRGPKDSRSESFGVSMI